MPCSVRYLFSKEINANLTLQKDAFLLYNTNQKIKLVTQNTEPEQKHAKLIYCILFTWKRNKQLSDYLLLLIPYFAFWHIPTIVVWFNKKKIQWFKNIYVFFIYLSFIYLLLLLSIIYLSSLRIIKKLATKLTFKNWSNLLGVWRFTVTNFKLHI
jgi:hypothetical protein